jgi:transcriptional regulator with XRE-family HTH domain
MPNATRGSSIDSGATIADNPRKSNPQWSGRIYDVPIRSKVAKSDMATFRNTQDFLEDFIFLDCQLGDHPNLISSVRWREGDFLRLLVSTGPIDNISHDVISLRQPGGLTSHIINDRRYFIASRHEYEIVPSPCQSIICVPIVSGKDNLEVLSIASKKKNAFEEEHMGRAQLLAAIIGYSVIHLDGRIRTSTPLSASLGEALRRTRLELVFTQAQLAEKIGTSRIALSRWESGMQSPSREPFYRWCQALGLFANRQATVVTMVDISPHLLKLLREHPEKLREISPSQLEHLIAERLDRMGFDVRLTGTTSLRDGGIDLIAVPKARGLGTFLLAGQVKHHKSDRKTGREAVDRLLAWRNTVFSLGLLATNTAFTRDAIWLAEQSGNKPFLRLRDFEDLKRWIQERFWSPQEWHEIPDEVTLAPGITVTIPKAILPESLKIWPLEKCDPNLAT